MSDEELTACELCESDADPSELEELDGQWICGECKEKVDVANCISCGMQDDKSEMIKTDDLSETYMCYDCEAQSSFESCSE